MDRQTGHTDRLSYSAPHSLEPPNFPNSLATLPTTDFFYVVLNTSGALSWGDPRVLPSSPAWLRIGAVS